jgi:predicted transporter
MCFWYNKKLQIDLKYVPNMYIFGLRIELHKGFVAFSIKSLSYFQLGMIFLIYSFLSVSHIFSIQKKLQKKHSYIPFYGRNTLVLKTVPLKCIL